MAGFLLDFAAGFADAASDAIDADADAARQLDTFKAETVFNADQNIRINRDKAKAKAAADAKAKEETVAKNVAISDIIESFSNKELTVSEAQSAVVEAGGDVRTINSLITARNAGDPVFQAEQRVGRRTQGIEAGLEGRDLESFVSGSKSTNINIKTPNMLDVANTREIQTKISDDEILLDSIDSAIVFVGAHPEVVGALAAGGDVLKSFFAQTKFTNEIANSVGLTDINASNRAKFKTTMINLLGRALPGITGDQRFTEGDAARGITSLGEANSIFSFPARVLGALDQNRQEAMGRLAQNFDLLENPDDFINTSKQRIGRNRPEFLELINRNKAAPTPLQRRGEELESQTFKKRSGTIVKFKSMEELKQNRATLAPGQRIIVIVNGKEQHGIVPEEE